jgi:hypothetical protein
MAKYLLVVTYSVQKEIDTELTWIDGVFELSRRYM